jgi:hypothetical protein
VVDVLIEEMFRSDRNRPRDYETSRGRRSRDQKKHEDHSSECTESCAQKRFDRADIVRDVRYARWIQSVDTTLVRHQPPEDYVLTEEGSDFIMQSALYNSIIAFGGSG